MQKCFIYILKCSDGTYYTGIANDLYQKLGHHYCGKFRNYYTYKRRPLKLVYVFGFANPVVAAARHKQIRNWSQAKKEALMSEDYDSLPPLAKKHF